jgi:hypothetical protein
VTTRREINEIGRRHAVAARRLRRARSTVLAALVWRGWPGRVTAGRLRRLADLTDALQVLGFGRDACSGPVAPATPAAGQTARPTPGSMPDACGGLAAPQGEIVAQWARSESDAPTAGPTP